MIEQRTNEILQKFATVQSAEAESATASAKEADADPLAEEGEEKPTGATEEEKAAAASAAVLQILGMGPATPMGQELIQVRGRERRRGSM